MMITRKVISILMIAIYGFLLMHNCVSHQSHHDHSHHIEANSIFIDSDGCLVHSDDGENECHHDNPSHPHHQHPDKYVKSSGFNFISAPHSDIFFTDNSIEFSSVVFLRVISYALFIPDIYSHFLASTVPTRGSPSLL